ncbi:MAG TPA: TetR/AcrR family transcriptional regulator [Acidobacteriaceae bacterium]
MLPVGGSIISFAPHPPSVARQRLLDAALLEFARAGFDGASIRTIMKLLGMRESGFYAHFPSKQAAYDALIEEGSPAVVTHWVSHIAADQAPDVALRRLAGEIMEVWSAPRARLLSSIVLRELFSGRSERRQELLTAMHEAQQTMERLLAAWQKRGAIRHEADPTSLAFEFLSPLLMLRILHFNQASTIEELREGDIRIARHVETFLQMVLVTQE